MGFSKSYSTLLLEHPGKVISIGVTTVISLFILTLTIKPIPTFRDPFLGFEVRGTQISTRLNTWNLLLDETTSTINNTKQYTNPEQNVQSNSIGLNNELGDSEPEPPLVEMSIEDGRNRNISAYTDMYDEDEEEYYRSVNNTVNSGPKLMHYSLGSSKAFCGKLYEGYAQVVITTPVRYQSIGLFNLNSIHSICLLDHRLRLEHSQSERHIFQNDCEQYSTSSKGNDEFATQTACCNSWSIPNYIACLNNKTSCFDIGNQDLKHFELLLNHCAPYYFKAPYEDCFLSLPKEQVPHQASKLEPPVEHERLSLPTSTHFGDKSKSFCGPIPEKCLSCDGWTYVVLNYLVNENFIRNKSSLNYHPRAQAIRNNRLKAKDNQLRDSIVDKLSSTNIFLPIAKSASLMNYYQTLLKQQLKSPFVQIKAMDLGMKNSLFEHLVSNDIRLFMISLILILFVISIYTWSFILSLVILMIICLSQCLAYSIYDLVFDIPIFPFMNLLAVVISFGICSDNAMLFCKHWSQEEDIAIVATSDNTNQAVVEPQKEVSSEEQSLYRTLRKAVVSTLVATLATACSFSISAISKVVAVRCFCIFATLSVLTNYMLIVLLLPPALIIDSRLHNYLKLLTLEKNLRLASLIEPATRFRQSLLDVDSFIHRKFIYIAVTKFKFYLIITFISLLACSSILVFHKPTLQPIEEDDVQLLSKQHSFEQYDKNLKRHFAFERAKIADPAQTRPSPFSEMPETLPIRIVFGVKPADNGNHLDPLDRGVLELDPKFNLSDANTQIWLLDFCHKLGQQRFVHPSNLPELSNCFIDTFKSWMDARSCKDPAGQDRSPCCQTADFPYNEKTIYKCLGEAITMMRKTPHFNPNVNAGVRFQKGNSKVSALIIEYQSNRLPTSNFAKMDRFYTDIEEWVSWHINTTAPPGLRSGWFISSNLDMLSMQLELQSGTMNSILLEVLFATIALIFSTRDAVLTIAGTLTIGTIIIVTIAVLILMRWSLGVAESILVSLTIGLSIDFALHYSVAFSEGRRFGSSEGVICRILNEVGSPITLATITTSLAGFVIFWSDILAYQELGAFLVVIALVSWMTSTFFLLPMLATIDSFIKNFDIRKVLRQSLKRLVDQI